MHHDAAGAGTRTRAHDRGEITRSAHPVGGWKHGQAAGWLRQLRPTARCGPCVGGPRRWRGRRGCACAAGSRASWRGGGCSAGKYACSRSDSIGSLAGSERSRGREICGLQRMRPYPRAPRRSPVRTDARSRYGSRAGPRSNRSGVHREVTRGVRARSLNDTPGPIVDLRQPLLGSPLVPPDAGWDASNFGARLHTQSVEKSVDFGHPCDRERVFSHLTPTLARIAGRPVAQGVIIATSGVTRPPWTTAPNSSRCGTR